ncbi:MAG TPA: sigma-70 family RNA polymerase sigma factor [Gemmataceae bacterium]|nr:sigma-70 family RNA polymerase sigma factor [Gemmataceae bacterium]
MAARTALNVVQLVAKSAGLGQRTDAQLLADFLDQKDPSAFEALVRRHGPLVLSTCRQVLRSEADAEDAFQATFVALYQKAAGIRRQPSVAGWLFRVARRTALRAHRAAARRDRHEARSPAKREQGLDLSWREACAALHAEMDRLPETYRSVLILCYLEGLSRDEAAHRLGWTLNEVRGRLERGRVRLRSLLEKRGVTLSAGLLAAVGAQGVPPALIASATRGAARPAARVADLALAATWGKVHALGALAIAAGLVVGVGLSRDDARANPQPPAAKDTRGQPAEPEKKDPREVAGRVLGPDGKPVAGARVWLVVPWVKAREVAKSGDDGTFRFTPDDTDGAKLTESEWVIRVVAVHDQFGVALPDPRASDLDLRFVKDEVPVRGRVLDLQGKPVAGVTVTPRRVQAASRESLDDWLAKLQAADEQANVITDTQLRRSVTPTPFLPPVTTDAEGRFTVTGVGRERLVELRIEGPTIATSEIRVMTREAKDVRVEYDPGNAKLGYKVYHGATFDFAADPTQPFRGIVTDKAAGKPIPRALVRSEYPVRIETVADADGRYTLRGLAPGEHKLVAAPPAGEPNLPLMMTGGRVNNHQPVTLDFALNPGVWIEGTVTDLRTKKPVAGASVYYSPLGDGPVIRFGGDPLAFDDAVGKTDADGKFRIVGVPGPGAIAINAPGGPYIDSTRRPLQGDALLWTLDWLRTRWVRLYFYSFDALAVVELDPKKPRKYSITVDPGETVKGRVLDPDGKPLAGARASRLTEYSGWTMKPLGVRFEAGQIQSGKPRFVLFWHEERKLGAIWRPKPGDADTYDVRLKPNGSAAGRLVDKEGQPLPDHAVEVYFRTPGETGWSPWFPMTQLRTDAKGRFELANLPEGVEFSVRYKLKKAPQVDYSFEFRSFEFRVKSGEAKELGDAKR